MDSYDTAALAKLLRIAADTIERQQMRIATSGLMLALDRETKPDADGSVQQHKLPRSATESRMFQEIASRWASGEHQVALAHDYNITADAVVQAIRWTLNAALIQCGLPATPQEKEPVTVLDARLWSKKMTEEHMWNGDALSVASTHVWNCLIEIDRLRGLVSKSDPKEK